MVDLSERPGPILGLAGTGGLLCWCRSCCTLIPLFWFCSGKDEWPVSQRALLPVLLPALPEPHCSQAGLPAPGPLLHLSARPGGDPRRALRNAGPALADRSGVHGRKRELGRRGGEVEASPGGEGRLSVRPGGAGHDGGAVHSLQQGEQDRLHVHPLCAQCQVNTGPVGLYLWACPQPPSFLPYIHLLRRHAFFKRHASLLTRASPESLPPGFSDNQNIVSS